jgi:uncharacterized protein YndB with AHSA1/START domain
MTARKKQAAMASSKALIITRVFDAPRELVWKAWTEPKHLMKWWGPKEFTCPVCKIDFRVGGSFHYCMRSPEGKDYWGTGVYKEIRRFEKIVVTDSFADKFGNVVPATAYGFEGDFPLELLITITFEKLKGKVKLTLRHDGFPVGKHKDMANTGWNESLDKLRELLMTKGI